MAHTHHGTVLDGMHAPPLSSVRPNHAAAQLKRGLLRSAVGLKTGV
jgi:hypothetical protein